MQRCVNVTLWYFKLKRVLKLNAHFQILTSGMTVGSHEPTNLHLESSFGLLLSCGTQS